MLEKHFLILLKIEKNSDWWGNETAEVKEKFLLTLKHRKILKSVDLEKDHSTDYALMLQIFLGKGDFFFCHWKAIDEQAIIDRLSVAGLEQFIVTMATPVDFPKINLDFLQPMINKLK